MPDETSLKITTLQKRNAKIEEINTVFEGEKYLLQIK